MEVGVLFQRLYHIQIQRLLLIIGMIVYVVVLFQLLSFPYKNYMSTPSHTTKGSVFVTVGSKLTSIGIVHRVVNNSTTSDSDVKAGGETEMESHDDGETDSSFEMDEDGKSRNDIAFESNLDLDKSLRMGNFTQADNSSTPEMVIEFQLGPTGHVKESDKNATLDKTRKTNAFSLPGEVRNQYGFESLRVMLPRNSSNEIGNFDADSRTPLFMEAQSNGTNNELLRTVSASWSNNSLVSGNFIMNRRHVKPTSIYQMTLLLLQSSDSSKSERPKWSSPRDRELQYARLQIENAPTMKNSLELHPSLFRNFSMFVRSYELMERMLKVYIYKEGEKPIFHQPYLRGIYASEGWFMKLIEGNKQFVARDPRKAHLFYLPFSSQKLRSTLHQDIHANRQDMEKYLKNYTDIIAKKYRFWNRARGADHFLVACHDWATRITRNNMGSSIRALCNANVARGFRVGKDVSLPVTYIRTSQDPHKDLGGNPPSERPILAFFAGSMHGYLRPILLQYWENKELDMKILGPMPRDIKGKSKYRGYMKNSKYCICARGYEVHTPRIVESIYYECVPVIISDNYVPPFFEVLNWEAFSVFVLERDIPNLRNILLSIPEEKYLAMQQRVKLVQRHFLWHKKAVKYDLFHMTLHSVWYNRVFQVKL
ncbi:hypothetical protein ACSBR2_038523 [Camellia fascicularis]